MKRSGAIGNKVAVTRRHIGEYDANRRLDIRDIRKITKDLILVNNEVSTKIWGCSSAGRAPALQAGGQEFDSPHLHHFASVHAPRQFFFCTCVQEYAAAKEKITDARKLNAKTSEQSTLSSASAFKKAKAYAR